MKLAPARRKHVWILLLVPCLVLLFASSCRFLQTFTGAEGEGESQAEGMRSEGEIPEGQIMLEGEGQPGEGAVQGEGEGEVPPGIDDTCENCSFEIVATYPHDRAAFTEGLDYDAGTLFEGTGLNGQSQLRRVDLATGQVVQHVSIDQQYFGEGIVAFGQQVFQLTWQSKIGFVYDRTTFQKLRDITYDTEGWGLTHDGVHLIMSDGTPTIYFRDPATFAVTRTLAVADASGPLKRINELEYVHGFIWSNVWETNRIVRIDPATGSVTGQVMLTGLLTAADMNPPVDVLNGIAYVPERDHLLVTGKLWPKLFEIKIIPAK